MSVTPFDIRATKPCLDDRDLAAEEATSQLWLAELWSRSFKASRYRGLGHEVTFDGFAKLLESWNHYFYGQVFTSSAHYGAK